MGSGHVVTHKNKKKTMKKMYTEKEVRALLDGYSDIFKKEFNNSLGRMKKESSSLAQTNADLKIAVRVLSRELSIALDRLKHGK